MVLRKLLLLHLQLLLKKFSSMLRFKEVHLEELFLVFLEMRFQKLLKTLELSALVKKESEEAESHFTTKDALSTG